MSWQNAPVVGAAPGPAWAAAPTVDAAPSAPVSDEDRVRKAYEAAIMAAGHAISIAPELHAIATSPPNFTPAQRRLIERGSAALRPSGAKPAKNFDEALSYGLQMSVAGLLLRGEVPQYALTADAPMASRLGANIGTMVGDAPAMVAGAIMGGAGGAPSGPGAAVTAGAGAFGLPAGLRAVLMDAYTQGEFKSFGDFWNRGSSIIWETVKGQMTGAATAGAGVAVRAAMPAGAPLVAKIGAPLAAEIATMVTVGSALEGHVPRAQDFLDAAVVLGGLKGSMAVAGKLRSIYAKTGIPPEQVAMEATRSPELRAEVVKVGDDLPAPYKSVELAETARAIVPGEKAETVAKSPFADELPRVPGEPAKPTHVNYNRINSHQDTKLAMARLSEVYEAEIQQQRRGTVSWEQTSAEAGKILSDTLGMTDPRLLAVREPGTPAGAAEILARKQLTIGAAEEMMAARDRLLELGSKASPEDQLIFLGAIERSAMIQAEFLGARAEAGRALNILKSTAMDAERIKLVQDAIQMYGKDPLALATVLKEIDTAAGAAKFAREAVKATTWEQFMEAIKASMLSGPITQIRNILGNTSFLATRPVIDSVAASFGVFRGGSDRVTLIEPLARVIGNLQGTLDGARNAAAVFRTGEELGKIDQFRKAIPGTLGEVVRAPFRLLATADTFFRTVSERGEGYALAVRQAAKEGLNPATREFQHRVAQLVSNPPKEMQEAMTAAGKRYTYQTELGEKGQAFQRWVKSWHLEWAIPFITTPANILKETARMTPGANLMVGEWRAAFKKGGAARDQALAEIATGTALMSAVFMLALNELITGAGSPDPGKRAVQRAGGWQPYSIKVGDTYYNYQGWGPVTTLIGLAADAATVWDHMDEEESDKVPKILSVAFANAVTNQTALMGMTNLVNVTSDPTRYGPRFFQGLAGLPVPALVAQPTAMLDPVAREVDSMLDAVKARIPGQRETLLPKRDVFGEPVKTKERLGGISPITETKIPNDKVRTEAVRLKVSAGPAPKKIHIGRGTGKIGDVKLEPAERDIFTDVAGHLAHDVLKDIVSSPSWDETPDFAKRQVFQTVFEKTRKAGAAAALPGERRQVEAEKIIQKVEKELAK